MLALLCFCVATEFSVNKDLYKPNYDSWQIKPLLKKAPSRANTHSSKILQGEIA